jgi:hypothetical protein
MQRIAIILGIGCLVVMCRGGVWLAARPPIEAVRPPDATDVHVGVGWWEWTLIYRTPRPLDEWYFPVVHQLEAAGWTRSEAGYAGRPLPLVDPVAYGRRTSFVVVVLWERVDLDGDLRVAHVRMHRWITLPWWP